MWAFEFIRRVLSYKGNAILAQLHDPERHPSQDAAVAQFAKHCHLYSTPYDKTQFATATVKALSAKVAGDGVDLDEDDLSGFFCSEFTAEAIKRAALNHDHAVRPTPYTDHWTESKTVKSSNISPADIVEQIPIVGPSQVFLKRQLNDELQPVSSKEEVCFAQQHSAGNGLTRACLAGAPHHSGPPGEVHRGSESQLHQRAQG